MAKGKVFAEEMDVEDGDGDSLQVADRSACAKCGLVLTPETQAASKGAASVCKAARVRRKGH